MKLISTIAILLAITLALSACLPGDSGDDEPNIMEPLHTSTEPAATTPTTADETATPADQGQAATDTPPTATESVPAPETPTMLQPAPSPTPAGTPTPSRLEPTVTPTATMEPTPVPTIEPYLEAFSVPAGSRPHDVAPAINGGVWYTGQRTGELGWLDPATGEVRTIPLGPGSAPHGVIVGPDGKPWITDGGQNAIVVVDPETDEVTVYPLPDDRPNANLNTAAFDGNGILWFTGQNGIYGRLDPATGEMEVFDAPRGPGPYGICATPDGDIYYASLAGSHIAHVDTETGEATVIEPPTPGQGARRVWSDSQGRIWVSEWNSGQVSVYDPADEGWREWPLPGENPQTYAVYVDDRDIVWLSDFGANAIVRFDPATEEFASFPLPHSPGNVRQILGRPGEVWAPESAADALVVIRTQ
ncbi:hypothetical protein BH23CHL2_BH23CHL2_33260 [soil metagenome]